MRRVRGFRWRVEREKGLYPKRGLGLWIERGSMGTTWREPGKDMFFSVTLLVGFWQVDLRANWKSLEPIDVATYEEMRRAQAEYNRRRTEEEALAESASWPKKPFSTRETR